jgi:carbamoyl-phosphate synthase small subunit
LGFGTYKLVYGHRGINQPVLDRATGKVEVTSHNHGFAVDAPLDSVVETEFGAVTVSHVCLNDNVVEGLRCLDAPAFTVQYHPEAAAGPHDADYLFDRFVELVGDEQK